MREEGRLSSIPLASPNLLQGWHEKPAASMADFGCNENNLAKVDVSITSPVTKFWNPNALRWMRKLSLRSFIALTVKPPFWMPCVMAPIPTHVSMQEKYSSIAKVWWAKPIEASVLFNLIPLSFETTVKLSNANEDPESSCPSTRKICLQIADLIRCLKCEWSQITTSAKQDNVSPDWRLVHCGSSPSFNSAIANSPPKNRLAKLHPCQDLGLELHAKSH